MRRLLLILLLTLVAGSGIMPAQAALPAASGSVKFAVIGDNGTGDGPEYDVGARLTEARSGFPFDMVIMLGDNMYGRQTPQDFVAKFQRPYAGLLAAGVLFYAALGNHDSQAADRSYAPFNMHGDRYYTFARQNARFLVLDSNQMDPKQLAWTENVLRQSPEDWKICYFHHPLYSDGGRHGSEVELRVLLEPLFVKHGVDVVFSGHDHVYERTKPQKGITYFVNGSSGELRKGDVHPSAMTAAYFDQDQAFSLVEIAGREMFFEARSRTGRVVDSGVIHRRADN
jgi:3',5'-cyclic AMP phosphodiesterase CpdA